MRTLAFGTFLFALALLFANFFITRKTASQPKHESIEGTASRPNTAPVEDVINRASQVAKAQLQEEAAPAGAGKTDIQTRQKDLDRYTAVLREQAEKAQVEQTEKLREEQSPTQRRASKPMVPSSSSTDNSSLLTMARIAFSALLLFASLYVILFSKVDPAQKHWAYGTIGTIVGFWFNAG